MRTVTGTITAYLTNSYGPEELQTDERALRVMVLHPCDMTGVGWTKVGMAEITVTMDDETQIIGNKVDALKAEKLRILGEAHAKATEIDGQIQNLLAITYVPEEV